MIKVQSIMQLVKDKAKNQMTSLFYSVQKRLNKKSEDPVVNLQCLQSVYMASFTQTRVNFLCHLNNSRALFESNPCDPLTCSDHVDYCYPLMERFLHLVTNHSKPIASLINIIFQKEIPPASLHALLSAYLHLLARLTESSGETAKVYSSYSIFVLMSGLSVMRHSVCHTLFSDPTLLCMLLRVIDAVEKRGRDLLTDVDLQMTMEAISTTIALIASVQ